MKKYILVHNHEYGVTVHHIKTNHKDVDEVINDMEKKIIPALNIDFEEDKNETIDIFDLPDVVTIL